MEKARLEVYRGEKTTTNQIITYPLTQRIAVQIPQCLLGEGPGAGHCKQSNKACGWNCRCETLEHPSGPSWLWATAEDSFLGLHHTRLLLGS